MDVEPIVKAGMFIVFLWLTLWVFLVLAEIAFQ
jgi:hypothetical protein